MVDKTEELKAVNGTEPETDVSEQVPEDAVSGYKFAVSAITVEEYAKYDGAKLANDFDEQFKTMTEYLKTSPKGSDPETYFKHFLQMRSAFEDAVSKNSDEAVGYVFDVEQITNADVSLLLRYSKIKNVDKLSALMEKYLNRKPKGITTISGDMPYSVFNSLLSQFITEVMNLGKN